MNAGARRVLRPSGMHVAIVGQGALGSVYGARLALGSATLQSGSPGAVDVSFVVRPSRSEETTPISIVRVDDGSKHRLEAPRRITSIPSEADVVLLCVSVQDLAALVPLLRPSQTPIVALTPLLPSGRAALDEAFGSRVFSGMPSIAAYQSADGSVRYWLPRVATTLIEEPQPMVPAVDALVRALVTAGVPSRLQRDTFGINAATTVTFLPIALALDVAGSAEALLEDRALSKLAIAGAREGQALGRLLGKPAPWAELLVHFVGPTMLKIGVALAKRRSPEAVRYVETHFGAKMHAQNVVMAEEIASLARERGLAHDALDALAERVRTRENRAPS